MNREPEDAANPRELKWVVYIDDNFHYMDESHRVLHGRFESLEEAITECVRITKDSVAECAGEDGANTYGMYGDDPWVDPRPAAEELSALLANHPEWPAEAFTGGYFSARTCAGLIIAGKVN